MANRSQRRATVRRINAIAPVRRPEAGGGLPALRRPSDRHAITFPEGSRHHGHTVLISTNIELDTVMLVGQALQSQQLGAAAEVVAACIVDWTLADAAVDDEGAEIVDEATGEPVLAKVPISLAALMGEGPMFAMHVITEFSRACVQVNPQTPPTLPSGEPAADSPTTSPAGELSIESLLSSPAPA